MEDRIWLEECSAEAFWSLDGITVPLRMENWDNCGIRSWPVCLSSAREGAVAKTLSVKRGRKKTQHPTTRTKISSWNSGGCGLNYL